MSGENKGLATELAELADSPTPPSGVDVRVAVQEGRTRLRRRRFAMVATAVAVAVVAASTSAVLLPGGGAASVRPADSATHSASPTSTGMRSMRPRYS